MRIIEKIIDLARDSLGDYCMNQCKAYCCKKGTLPVSDDEARMFSNKKTEGEEISVVLPCENLDEKNMCSVYKKRPKACREYPIRLDGKYILISKRCYGVADGRLYPFISQFKKEGFEVFVR